MRHSAFSFRSRVAATLFAALFAAPGPAADLFLSVFTTDGTVQIKHEESRSWEPLKKGADIVDNDQIQTSFKSKCEIRIGDNIIYLGANSRMLINRVEKPSKILEISVTLFSGSVYSKINRGIDYVIFTSTAQAKSTLGIFNCTVDEVTGISGFHAFKGGVTLSNISVQGELVLKSGETSTLSAGTPPSTPRKISAKQMSVLTRFYGSDFINQEIEETGVEVVSAAQNASASETKTELKPAPGTAAAAPGMTEKKQGKGFRLFDKEGIAKRLRDHEKEMYRMAEEPRSVDPLNGLRYRFGATFSRHTYGETAYPGFQLRQGIYFKRFHFALSLPLVADSAGNLTVTYQNRRHVLDKIHSAQFEYMGSFVRAGAIEGLTYGSGLVVRDYSNRAASDNVRGLGLLARWHGYCNDVEIFTPDLSNPHLLGARYFGDDSAKRIECSIIREMGQTGGLNDGDAGYRAGSNNLPAVPTGGDAAVTFVEAGGVIKLLSKRPLRVHHYFNGAVMIIDDDPSFRNFGLTLSGISVTLGKWGFDVDLGVTGGRFIRGFFGPLYEDNLYRVTRDSLGRAAGSATLTSALIDNHITPNAGAKLRWSPLKGTLLTAALAGSLIHLGKVAIDTSGNTKTQKVPGPKEGDLDLSFRIGDGFILPRLSWFEAFYRIRHITYFDRGPFDPFTPNPFTQAGGTLRLAVGKSFELSAGYDLTVYDVNGDFTGSPSEKVPGFSAGLAAGF